MSTEASTTVVGMIIHAEGDRKSGIFTPISITPSHEIHEYGDECPVSRKVGLSLIMYRHSKEDPLYMERDAKLDNQIATFLMIDPISGFAPPRWQQCVGTVTVMRKDGKPLTNESIETIWMYHDHLLDCFGDSPGDAHRLMNPTGFKDFCENYKDEGLSNGRNEFEGMEVPL